ncbi:MAG: primosomal protein N' [Chloroflexi bacterium]|nr:primosomal protein N' [Chloroflexota bacterium]
MARFAEVVVNTHVRHTAREQEETYTPAGLTFHYSIPPDLADTLRPGHLVRVPFRNREVHGIVIALHDQSPVPETRPILGLVYPTPVLTETQLALARWMAEHYLTPLLYVLKLFLPPRLTAPPEPVLERTSSGPLPPDLSPEQVLLLERLRHGPVPESQLRGGGVNLTQDRILQPLLKRGLIRRKYMVTRRPPQARHETFVQLATDEENIAHILPQLGRHNPRADVLAFLLSWPDPLPTAQLVMENTGVSRQLLKRMAEEGGIGYQPGTTRVIWAKERDVLEQQLEELSARAPAQARALRAVLEQGNGVSLDVLREQGIDRAILNKLAARGLIRLVEEPALVYLRLSPEEAENRILDLRGTQAHRRVLQALQDADEPVWLGWLLAETGADRPVIRELESAGLVHTVSEEVFRDPLRRYELPTEAETPPPLTPEQQRAWDTIRQAWVTYPTRKDASLPPVFLLHGVTGSGKTEIYLRAVAHVLREGGQVLFLVPEIALTPQTIQRVAARFPGLVTVWHSELSVGERFDVWRRIMSGEARVVVGTRSALFAPYAQLRLIIVDEEHDESYKNQRLPYYHARAVAIELARLSRCPVILGSATPDVVTYTRAIRGVYRLLRLPHRVLAHRRHLEQLARESGDPASLEHWQPLSQDMPDVRTIPLPPVRVVDMRLELKAGNRSMLSRPLQAAIREALERQQQVILFINRRGRASFVMCRDCGHVLRCDRCSVPLTFHLSEEGNGRTREKGYLLCHHCNRRYPVPDRCPMCGSSRIRYFGGGTQRVEEEVRRLFPQARILRWDRDTTRGRDAHWHILEAFAHHQADILIGTQMLAKGLDLPRVTVVGVISADEGLFLPDFRAAERTFQVLTQVAGRAGRGLYGGRVIVQTYHPEHYAVRAAAHHDYEMFYRQEMAFRRLMHYPPYARLVRLLYTHTREDRARQAAEHLAQALREALAREGVEDISLIGPAPCFYTRLRGQYRWHIILRGRDPVAFLKHFPLPQGWRPDVDPYNTL